MSQETSRRIQLHALGESEEQISNLVNELISYCLELDIEVSRDEAEMCIKHLLMVNQVNEHMNLTRIQDIHDALILHIVDSLALTRDLPIEPERFLDIGTGAASLVFRSVFTPAVMVCYSTRLARRFKPFRHL